MAVNYDCPLTTQRRSDIGGAKTTSETRDATLAPIAQNKRPKICSGCHQPGQRRITSWENTNGNAGRPYYYCTPCAKFITFDDKRGLCDSNPRCDCGQPSRAQVNGRNRRPPRGVHYVCKNGCCDFFARAEKNGQQVAVAEDFIDRLANLSII
ncbi:hypothetical protein BKA67DRAFT_568410 [Truncatella angustata]|uniref:GRF-like zinc ribbon domain-containing protein n=1 Tax=Truncatella angustata TaxID=152316 RepID=A0A9P8ZXG7_9PEZI|nr:uncharacterized protein BKA67DRAFT_568410 [Truncatella angustata]KAH6653043.1 hypothetical protein BKA67DRAFT_568410 [Truncatella angustata]